MIHQNIIEIVKGAHTNMVLALALRAKNFTTNIYRQLTKKLNFNDTVENLRAQVIERLILIIALLMVPITSLIVFITPGGGIGNHIYTTSFGYIILFGLRILLKQGHTSLVAKILSSVFICIPMAMLYSLGTVSNLLIAYCILGIIISSFLLSSRMTLIYASITILGSIGLFCLEMLGILPQQEQASTSNQIILFVILVLLVTIVFQIESVNRKKLRLALAEFQNELTERTRVEKKLSHTVLHDGLTHLPNRSLLKQKINSAIVKSKEDPHNRFALLYLDIDRFKVINDSMGHAVGDQVLIEFGKKIGQGLRSSDTVARLGGDEFVILLNDINSRTDAINVAKRVLESIEVPIRINGKVLNMSTSIGISYNKLQYKNADEVLRDADIAMYQSKDKGKNMFTIYDSRLQQKISNKIELENDFHTALENQEFIVCYQPIIDLQKTTISGFEALVRWQHPKQGLISPMQFIPIAEETGQIQELNMFVLRTAAKQFHTWKESKILNEKANLSVNISAICLETPFYAQKVTKTVQEVGFNPNYLTLEITEGLLISNLERNIQVLEKLQTKGIKVSIDDFGTGYSSLSYLHKLPLNNIKIDKSFVMGMDEDIKNQRIIETIIALAKSLNMKLIAEGIETPEQLQKLQNLNCDYAQGFFFSRALSVEQMPDYLAMVYGQDHMPPPHSNSHALPAPLGD